MIKFYNVKDSVKDDNKLQESQIKEIEVNDEEDLKPLTAVEINNTPTNGKVEKDDKQSFEDFKNLYKGVIDMKCNQEYGSNEDKDLWEDCAKELFLKSKTYLLKGDEYKGDPIEKKEESKTIIKESYYIKLFNKDNTDIDTIEVSTEQEAIKTAEEKMKEGWRAVVYNVDNKEALYDYNPFEELEESLQEEEITPANIKEKALEILPKEDVDVKDSDLYIKVSDKSKELISKLQFKNSGLLTTFRSPIDNEMWYDIPFANLEDYITSKTESNNNTYDYKSGDVVDILDSYGKWLNSSDRIKYVIERPATKEEIEGIWDLDTPCYIVKTLGMTDDTKFLNGTSKEPITRLRHTIYKSKEHKMNEGTINDNATILEALVDFLNDNNITADNIVKNKDLVEKYLSDNKLGISAYIPTIYKVGKDDYGIIGRIIFYRSKSKWGFNTSSMVIESNKINESFDLDLIEKNIKGKTLSDAARYLGALVNGDKDSFKVVGTELISKLDSNDRVMCAVKGNDIIGSIVMDLTYLTDKTESKKVKVESETDDGYVYVHTGLSDDKTEYILNSVIGQISDGIWEGSRGMDKIWQYMDVEKMNGELVMKVYTKYPSGFEGKTEDQISKYVAQKIKQIAKINIDHQNVRSMDGSPAQWDRNETATLTYFGGKDDDPITVRDAYKVYDSILGRKQRIESKQLESRDRVAENLSKFIYDLTTDKDTETYGETAWSGNQPTKMGNGVTVYEVYKNGKSNYTMDDIEKAVIERFPELDVYGTAYNSILFYKPQKTELKLQEDTVKFTLNTNLNESNIDKYNTIPEIKDRLKEINKQLAYIRRRDSVSLSIGTEQEQEELRSERAKLSGRLRKLRNNAVDMDKMTSEQQKEFKQRLKDLQLLDDDESNLQSAIQSYRNHYIQEFESYTKKEENNTNLEYNYMLLDRLRSDCEYFLGNGNRNEKHLWAGSVDAQINEMKKIWNSLKEKPEWLTMEDINDYEKLMKDKKAIRQSNNLIKKYNKELEDSKEKKTEDSTNNKLDNSYNDFLHFGLDFIDIWFSPYEWYKDPEKAKEYWYNIPYSHIIDYIDKEFNDFNYYRVKEACEESDVAKKRLQEVWKEYVERYVKDYNPTSEKIYQNYVNKVLDRDLYPTKTDDSDNIKYPEEMFLNFTKELKNKVGIDEAIDLLYNSYDYGRRIYCIDKQGYEYTYKIKDTEVKVRDNESIKRAESELRTAKSVLDTFLSPNTSEETKRDMFINIQDLDNKIDYIKYFYKRLPEKPDWLSLEDINNYREKGKNMLDNIYKKTEVTERDLNNEDKKEESVVSDYTLNEIKKVIDSNGNDFTIKIVNSNEDAQTKTLNIDREDLISVYNVLGGNKDELVEDINNEYNSLPIGNITITVSEQPNNSVYLEIQDKNNTTISDMFIKPQIQTIVNFLNRLLSDNKNKSVKEESAISDYTLTEALNYENLVVLNNLGETQFVKARKDREDKEFKKSGAVMISNDDPNSLKNAHDLAIRAQSCIYKLEDIQSELNTLAPTTNYNVEKINRILADYGFDAYVTDLYRKNLGNLDDVSSCQNFVLILINQLQQIKEKDLNESKIEETKNFIQSQLDKSYNKKYESRPDKDAARDKMFRDSKMKLKLPNKFKDINEIVSYLENCEDKTDVMNVNVSVGGFNRQLHNDMLDFADKFIEENGYLDTYIDKDGNEQKGKFEEFKQAMIDFVKNYNLKKKEEKLNDYTYVIYRQRLVKAPVYVKDYSTETEDINEAITFPTEQEAEEYKNELELSYKEQYKIGVKD